MIKQPNSAYFLEMKYYYLHCIIEDTLLGKKDKLYLDMFPNYHVGPSWSSGAYGVLWDYWGADTRLAIWALVSRVSKSQSLR